MTDTSMVSIGEKLKKARESRSLTIDQVQKQTRIHSTVLAALEEGRSGKMLTPTYEKSFLKKYAVHLGLEVAEVMGEYLAAHPEAKQAEQLQPPATPGAKRGAADILSLLRRAAPLGVAVAVIAVFVFMGGALARFLSDRGRVKAVVVADAKVKKAEPARQSAAPKAKEPASATVAKEMAPAPSVKAQKPAESRPPAKGDALNLVLKAKRDVLVMARVDGEVVFKRLLPRGTTETMKADRSINLYIAKGEAVELTLNGKTLPSYGRGLIKDLEITRKGVRTK